MDPSISPLRPHEDVFDPYIAVRAPNIVADLRDWVGGNGAKVDQWG